MPRSGRLRNFIFEYCKSPKTERMSFLPPFLILIIETILLIHAIQLGEEFVIILTLILLFISVVETLLVSREIHEHYTRINFDKMLAIRLDDFIIQRKEKNVKKIVEKFIDEHPEYKKHRNNVYHTACQILQTHKEEKIEKEYTNKLKKYIKSHKDENVDEILNSFIKKYPELKKYRAEIYKKACQIKGKE